MAHIPAKLLSRLIQLEYRLVPKPCPNYIFIMEEIPQNRQCSLADGERIILDAYRQRGPFVEARQRITTNPNDHGRECEPGGYLLDVIEEIHMGCPLRGTGNCHTCSGTPVAAT